MTQATPDNTLHSLRADEVFVVVNPAAAGGDVGDSWGEISLMLNRVLGPSYGWAMTAGPGDATELARKALQGGFRVIASLGGDGTHNEVVNGFFDSGGPIRDDAVLAVLPFGTGGDFRKTLALSGDLEEAAERIAAGYTTPCDVGHLYYTDDDGHEAERYFINIASFGIGGLVDRKVNASTKALGGTLTFMLGTVRAFAEYEPPLVRLSTGPHMTFDARINNVAVSNGRFFGGGMKVAPHAKIDDGLFDIVVVRPADIVQSAQDAFKLYEGRHFESPAVSLLQATTLHAEPIDPSVHVLLDVDGEAPGRLPATFTVLPGVIRILVQAPS